MTDLSTSHAGEESEPSIQSDSLRIVAKYSAIAGLCPIIPVPFLDDAIIKRVRRRMLRQLGENHDLLLSSDAAKTLTERESHLLRGALTAVLFYPIKRLMRKVLIVFLVKACADVATATVEEGWLFARAIEAGYVDGEKLVAEDEDELRRLHDAIVTTTNEVDSSAARAAMRSVFGIFKSTFGEFKGVMKRMAKESGDSSLDEIGNAAPVLIENVEKVIREEWTNFDQLDRTLRRELENG